MSSSGAHRDCIQRETWCIWDPMPEFPITLPHLIRRLQHSAQVDLIPLPESTLYPSQGLRIWAQGCRLCRGKSSTFRVCVFLLGTENI
jgi:hypothetical protein